MHARPQVSQRPLISLVRIDDSQIEMSSLMHRIIEENIQSIRISIKMFKENITEASSSSHPLSPNEWGMRIFNPYNPPPIRPDMIAATSSHNDE